MTTLLAALHAIERGDPCALRMAVDAIGVALDALGHAEGERDEQASAAGEVG